MYSSLAQIVDGATAEEEHLKQSNDQQDREQHHRECRGIPSMEELKSLAKNVEVEHTGGIYWATLGHRIHSVEYLCRADDVGHELKAHGWTQHLQCYRDE